MRKEQPDQDFLHQFGEAHRRELKRSDEMNNLRNFTLVALISLAIINDAIRHPDAFHRITVLISDPIISPVKDNPSPAILPSPTIKP